MDWSTLLTKRVSILITGHSQKKECYKGIVVEYDGIYIHIESLPSDSFEIGKFIIKTDIIESVRVYK